MEHSHEGHSHSHAGHEHEHEHGHDHHHHHKGMGMTSYIIFAALAAFSYWLGLRGTLIFVACCLIFVVLFFVILFRLGEGAWLYLKPSTKAVLGMNSKKKKLYESSVHQHDPVTGLHVLPKGFKDDTVSSCKENYSDRKEEKEIKASEMHAPTEKKETKEKEEEVDVRAIPGRPFKSKSHPPQSLHLSFIGRIVAGLHAYFYSCWPHIYISIILRVAPYLGEGGRTAWSNSYHGKVLTHDQAEDLVNNDRDIPLQDVGEQIIPYPVARNILLQKDMKMAVFNCPCRVARGSKRCNSPLDVCMVVGDSVDFVVQHQDSARPIDRTEALKILRQEHRLGHVHTAFFKDVVANRFFCLCNCCSCCCGGIEMMVKHNCPAITSSGYVAKCDTATCKIENCEKCVKSCPFNAITIVDGKIYVDEVKCMGCGVCESRCPHKCFKLELDPKKRPPLDVKKLATDW
eukprot:TRINITY_DN11795_c0_g1_i1.p1 TRINITY_DN11795_c0_g1~~TRINITY_DN11795_c0_g1_i1.p1  ORF type:complete len:458 (+),score=91.03 TRINITY_DN11795_c0_g1_i1:50-1423(+)